MHIFEQYGAGARWFKEMDMTKDGDEGIKIVDRRRFTDDGVERESDDGEASSRERPVDAGPTEEPSPPVDGGGEPMPEVDFVTFILSLSQTAVLSLGLGPQPGGGKQPPRDLQAARWTIDALEMLHSKTQGNLTGEEERIFERILTELRMAYVQISGQAGRSRS